MRSLFSLKYEKQTSYYHIYLDGERITDVPLSIAEIKTRCKSIRRLEKAGFRVIRHR